MPTVAFQCPMAPGEVIAVGDDVDEFSIGDPVVGTFWPQWRDGEMPPAAKRPIPGETLDGYARPYACMPARFFTRAPGGLTHVEASTLPCAGVTVIDYPGLWAVPHETLMLG